MPEQIDPGSTMYLPNKTKLTGAELCGTTDARTWAEQFFLVTEDTTVDEDTMTAWFANAIETGRAAGSL